MPKSYFSKTWIQFVPRLFINIMIIISSITIIIFWVKKKHCRAFCSNLCFFLYIYIYLILCLFNTCSLNLNIPRYSRDNIVTCSRDGSAIIWVPRSYRSYVSSLSSLSYFPLIILCWIIWFFACHISFIEGKSTMDEGVSSKSPTSPYATSASQRGPTSETSSNSSRSQYDCLEPG